MVPDIYQGLGVSVGVRTGCLNLSFPQISDICEAKEPQILQPNGSVFSKFPQVLREAPYPGAMTQPGHEKQNGQP